MKTKAKYVIVILFLCTIPLYFCRMIGWKDDAIRLYDVILYGMESQEGDYFVGGIIWKLMQESVFENINAWLIGTAAVTLVGSVLVTLLNVWVGIALHVLILIFALWGMVSKEKSASKKSISRKIEPEKIKSKKTESKKIKPEEPVSKNPAASKMRSACPSCGRIPKEGEKFCTRCGSKLQ